MGERENRRARGRHARGESPSRAPVFSCAHYFQALATRATLYSLFSSGGFFCYNKIRTVPYLYCKQTNTSVWRGNKDLVSLLKALPANLHNIPEKIEKDVICTVQWGLHTSKCCIFFFFLLWATLRNNWGADGPASFFYTGRPQPADVPLLFSFVNPYEVSLNGLNVRRLLEVALP